MDSEDIVLIGDAPAAPEPTMTVVSSPPMMSLPIHTVKEDAEMKVTMEDMQRSPVPGSPILNAHTRPTPTGFNPNGMPFRGKHGSSSSKSALLM